MARIYSLNDPKESGPNTAGFDSFDFGYQIGLWLKNSNGELHCCRLSRADAAELGRALATAEEW